MAKQLIEYSVQEIIAAGQQRGLPPEKIAEGVQRWQGAVMSAGYERYGKGDKADPERYWKGYAKTDEQVHAAITGLSVAAADRVARAAFPDPAQREQLKQVIDSSLHDPDNMDAPPEWQATARAMAEASNNPAFALPIQQSGTIGVGPNALASYELRRRPQGDGYEAFVQPVGEGKKPVLVQMPTLDTMQIAAKDRLLEATAAQLRRKLGANMSELGFQKGLDEEVLNADVDAAKSRYDLLNGEDLSSALHTGLNTALTQTPEFLKQLPENWLQEFSTRPFLGVARSAAQALAGVGIGDERALTREGADARELLAPGKLRSRFEMDGRTPIGDQISQGLESAITLMGPSITTRMAGRVMMGTKAGQMAGMVNTMNTSPMAGGTLPFLSTGARAATVAEGAGWGSLYATAYGANYAGSLQEADALQSTDPERANRIRALAQYSSLTKAGIELATERIFPDEAKFMRGQAQTWRSIAMMPLKEGVEEGVGAVASNVVNTVTGQRFEDPAENAVAGFYGSVGLTGVSAARRALTGPGPAAPAQPTAPLPPPAGFAPSPSAPLPPGQAPAVIGSAPPDFTAAPAAPAATPDASQAPAVVGSSPPLDPTTPGPAAGPAVPLRGALPNTNPETTQPEAVLFPGDSMPTDGPATFDPTLSDGQPVPVDAGLLAPAPEDELQAPVGEDPELVAPPLTRPTAVDPQGTVPETMETMVEQRRRVISGQRPAMLLPGMTIDQVPADLRPGQDDNLLMTQTAAGTFVHGFDVSQQEIEEAVATGQTGRLLGMPTGSKPQGATAAVVQRNQAGTEVTAVAVTPDMAQATVDQLTNAASPGDTIGLETPEQVLSGRMSVTNPNPIDDTAQNPSTVVFQGNTTQGAQAPDAVEFDLWGDEVIPPPQNPSRMADWPITYPLISDIKLSKDVGQFKADADPETGVVAPLGGTYDRFGTGPITLWRRLNGQLEVISGRHRFDLAKRSGETTIAAQIAEESQGFTMAMAITADAELNIKDEKGTIKDFALYFRGSPDLSEQAATERGLLARAPGKAGWAVGRLAGPSVFELHQNDKLTDAAAAAIAAAAPNNEALQRLGAQNVLNGQPIDVSVNLMRAASSAMKDAENSGSQLDLFGADDSALQAMQQQAKNATSIQRRIKEKIAAAQGAAKRPDVARQMGVNVDDPAAVKQQLDALRAELDRWQNWPIHPDLVAQTREDTGKLREDLPDLFATAGVDDPFNLTPESPKDRARRQQREASAAAAAAAQKRQKDRQQLEKANLDLDFSNVPETLDPAQTASYTVSRGAPADHPDQADLAATVQRATTDPAYSQPYDLFSQPDDLFNKPVQFLGVGGVVAPAGPVQNSRPERGLTPEEKREKEAERYTNVFIKGKPADFTDGPLISSVMTDMVNGKIPVWDIAGTRILSPKDFALLLMPLRTPLFESMKVAIVDIDGNVLHSQILSVGTLGQTDGAPRDILRAVEVAKGRGAVHGVYVSHNHPSGKVDPSKPDVELTEFMRRALKTVGLPLLDHVITNGERYYSFTNQQAMDIPHQRAPWEAVSTTARPDVWTQAQLGDILRLVRQQTATHGHIIYLDTQGHLIAVERTDASTAGDLAKAAVSGGVKLGARYVSLDMGHIPGDRQTLAWLFMDYLAPTGILVADVASANVDSFRAAGLLQERPAFDSPENTLREPDLSPGYGIPAVPNEGPINVFGQRVEADARLRASWRDKFTPAEYSPYTEEELTQRIREWIGRTGGLEGASRLFLDEGSGLKDYERNALGQQLAIGLDLRARRAEAAGQAQAVHEAEAGLDQVIFKLERLATQAGQALRAFGMWARFSPRGIVRQVQRQTDQIRADHVKANLDVSPEQATDIFRTAVQSAIAEATEDSELVQLIRILERKPQIGQPILDAINANMPRPPRPARVQLPELANFRRRMTEQGGERLARQFWQLMAGPREGPGALAAFDNATQVMLADLLRRAVQRAGLANTEGQNNQPTAIDKIVMNLSRDNLRWDKIEQAEVLVQAEIDAIEDPIKQAALRAAWEEATGDMTYAIGGPALMRRVLINAMSGSPVNAWKAAFDTGKPRDQAALDMKNRAISKVMKQIQQGITTPQGASMLPALQKELEETFDGMVTQKYQQWLMDRARKEATAKTAAARAAFIAALRNRGVAESRLKKLYTFMSDTPTYSMPGEPNPINALISKHLVDEVPDFMQKMAQLGVTADLAGSLDRISAENRRRAGLDAYNKAVQSALARLKPRKRNVAERVPKIVRHLMEAKEAGVMERMFFLDAYAKAFNLPRFTPEFAASVRTLADRVEATPQGSWLRNVAQRNLMAQLALWEGIPARSVLTAYWYANILSGFGTQLVNITGNATHLVLKTISTVLSNNPKHSVQFIQGMVAGAAEGAKQGYEAFTQGTPVMRGETHWQKQDVLEMLWSDNPTTVRAKIVKYGAASWGRYVFRGLTAMDAFFFSTAKEGRAWLETSRQLAKGGDMQAALGLDTASWSAAMDQAKTDLQTAGVATPSTRQIDRRALEIVESKRSVEVTALARRFGAETTYNYKPEGTMGALAEIANLGVRLLPFTRPAVPFVNIVANVADQSLDWTPVGVARALKGKHLNNNKGQEFSRQQRIEKLVSGVLGTAGAAALYLYAKSFEDQDDETVPFMVYGMGPEDDGKRKQMPRGWKPFSVKVGDQYFSYAETPLGIILSVVGTSMDRRRYSSRKDADTVFARGQAIIQGSAQSLLRTGVLSGLDKLFGMLRGTTKPSEVFYRTAAGLLPAQGAMRNIAQALDPTSISSATFEGALLSSLPVLRSQGQPNLNVFGENVREPGPWLISRIVTHQDNSDPEASWLTRNKLHVPALDTEMTRSDFLPKETALLRKAAVKGGMKGLEIDRAVRAAQLERQADGYLTSEERTQFQRISGPLTRTAVKQVRREVETGSFKPADDKALQRHMSDKITAVRRMTRLQMVK